jgi:murein hydrolase activator
LGNQYLYAAGYNPQDPKTYKQTVKEKQSDLEILNYKIKAKEKIAEDIRNKKENLSQELEKIGTGLTTTEQTLKNVRKNIKKVETETRTTEEKLAVSNTDFNTYKKYVTEELNVFRRQNMTGGLLKIVARDNTSGYFARGDKALKIILVADYASLNKTQDEINTLQTFKAALVEKNQELCSLNNIESSKKYSYIKTKKKKDLLLKTTQTKEIQTQKEINDLKRSARELEAFIDNLRLKLSEAEKKRLKSSGLVERRGNLTWPITGDVTSLFGKYKRQDLDTYFFNNGIEIQGRTGGGVIAVEEGVVLFASDFKGYGKTVIIEHTQELCTVYGHLGKIEVTSGQYIKKKDTIGTLADTSLYFEIRLDNKPEDPLLWLTSEEQER